MGRFQLHPGRGAKNAKKGESESLREQKTIRAQRATLIQVGSCRVTNALLLLLAQALHFLLQAALALPLLGVLGALLPVATTIDQHLLLHHTMAESGRRQVKWWVETGLREMGAPAGTCYAVPATLGPYTHPRLGVDVPRMVWGAVHLGGDGDQVHLEVRGVPQLDDAGDSI